MINKFSGKYFFLSNFYEAPCRFEGLIFSNSEAAFQSAKTTDVHIRQKFTMMSPSESKEMGRKLKLRSDWEQIKDQVMYDVVLSKFTENPDLCQKLLSTGNAEIIEGNVWHDNYWGRCTCEKCTSLGHTPKNQLGITLMKVRSVLSFNIPNGDIHRQNC